MYDGNSGTNAINNGLELAGEGGLVWCKRRDVAGYNHHLYDTERGVTKYLSSNNSNGNSTTGTDFSSFNSNGFTLGTPQSIGSGLNATGADYASWTFRKAPGFFDVTTWTGNATNRVISHNLGSVPGMIIVKRTDDSGPWLCYHRSLGNTKNIELQSTNDEDVNAAMWNNTDPTSTHFTVGTNSNVNGSGRTFVAYIFAHDDAQYGTCLLYTSPSPRD